MKRLILLTLFAYAFSFAIFAQTDTAFWFAVPFATPDHDGPVKACLVITMHDYGDTVIVEQPAPPASFSPIKIALTAKSTYKLSLDAYMFNTTTNTIDSYPTGAVTSTSWNGTNPVDNNALHIYSKRNVEFSCYYEQDPYASSPGSNNPDIWVLKGNNALGTDFYVPFQTTWTNQNFTNWPAYSSFDIVAIKDNTSVTITPSKPDAGGHAAGVPYTITLNRGQTFSVAPKLIYEKNGSAVNWYAPSRQPADKLAGSHVTANQPIAISIKDDSEVKSTAYDMIGDQLVPLYNIEGEKVIGNTYIVMRGKVDNTNGGENIYITTTANNTTIFVSKVDGSDSTLATGLAAGKQVTYTIPLSKTSIYVHATNPIYVFHVSGFIHELGGALIPSIDGCTGSLEVSFVRSIGPTGSNVCNDQTKNNLFLNLMTKADAIDSFYIETTTGGTQRLGDKTWFQPVGTTGWYVLKDNYKCFSQSIIAGTTVRIWNTEDVFHLGLINGVYSGGGCRYGYFSNYNEIKAKAVTINSGTNLYTNCELDTVQLQASGGILGRFQWFPTDYLIDSPTIPNPRAVVPRGWTDFYCKIKQPCYGYDTLRITVFSPLNPFAFFTLDKSQTCYPDTVFTIKNKSENATKYRWTFGDGTPIQYYSTPEIDYSYTNRTNAAKTFPIYLEAENADGCLSSFKTSVTVYPFLKASFTSAPAITGCHPLTVDFTNTSIGNVTDTSYIWNFADNNSTDDKSPSHTFLNFFNPKDTVYKVRMVATSPFYCRDTVWQNITVHPYIKASFTVDTVSGCSPVTITLHNRSEGAINSYAWDFGDGSPIRTESKDTLIHTYPINFSTNPVIYKLLLTITNASSSGCPDTITRFITVNPSTKVSFTPSKKNICDSTVVKFTANPSPAVTSYEWTFGDGGTSNQQNPEHVYRNFTNKDTVHIVRLSVASNQYCSGFATDTITVHPYIDPEFAIDAVASCTPYTAKIINSSRGGIVGYSWNFGDGQWDYTINPGSHVYHNNDTTDVTKTLTLTVQNSGGCKDSISHDVLLYPEMSAKFTQSAFNGCNPLTVTFANQSDSRVAKTFFWEFGDGTSSLLVNPTHTFTNTTAYDKQFNIKLTTYSKMNTCKDSIIKSVTAFSYIDADFAVEPAEGCSPLPITFTNASSGGIVQDTWNFFGFFPSRINQPSSFKINFPNTTGGVNQKAIQLSVSNSQGCTVNKTHYVTIYPQVTSKFGTINNITEGCNELSISYQNQSGFTGLSSILPPTFKYDWQYGDSASSDEVQPQHTFVNLKNADKSFKTRLIVTSQNNCSDTSFLNIKVYPYLKADFVFDEPAGCSPFTITVHNSSDTAFNRPYNRYYWDFGDGYKNTLSNQTFSHTYRNLTPGPVLYYPQLILAYNNGNGKGDMCKDTMKRQVQVDPEVKAAFTQDTLKGCNPLLINFTNMSTIGTAPAPANTLRYTWTFGDNGSSFSQDTKHTYINYSNIDSTLTITLKAESILYGCTNTISKLVSVYPKPKARFYVDKTIDCPPFPVPINNQSEAGDIYRWNFGDGDTLSTNSLGTISHTYLNDLPTIAAYNLNLNVGSIHNCWDQTTQTINVYPKINVDFQPDTAGCNPLQVTFRNYSTIGTNTVTSTNKYTWNFGDGTPDFYVKNPAHLYYNNTVNDVTYKVTLIGNTQFNCSDTAYRNITVYPQPLAEFALNTYYLTFPDNKITINNQTNPGDWSYSWNFDDGIASPDDTTRNAGGIHEYMHWGNYNVLLKTWSDHCSDSVTHRVTVFPPIPIPDFDMTQNDCVPLSVKFTDKSTWATGWLWDFYDGETSTEQNPTHIFTKAGTYKVKLTVTGDGGSAYRFDEVIAYPLPVVEFDAKPQLIMLNTALEAPVKFYNKSNLGVKFLWEFGDTATSEEIEPVHIYRAPKLYTVKLGAWTDKGCYASLTKPDYINVMGEGIVDFPNAFTPNINEQGDGSYDEERDTKNEVFHPYSRGVIEYHLEIYARWGDKLFETDDIKKGWNGYYKGKLCKTDVYIWKAKGKFTDGGTFEKAGNVTLLR